MDVGSTVSALDRMVGAEPPLERPVAKPSGCGYFFESAADEDAEDVPVFEPDAVAPAQ